MHLYLTIYIYFHIHQYYLIYLAAVSLKVLHNIYPDKLRMYINIEKLSCKARSHS